MLENTNTRAAPNSNLLEASNLALVRVCSCKTRLEFHLKMQLSYSACSCCSRCCCNCCNCCYCCNCPGTCWCSTGCSGSGSRLDSKDSLCCPCILVCTPLCSLQEDTGSLFTIRVIRRGNNRDKFHSQYAEQAVTNTTTKRRVSWTSRTTVLKRNRSKWRVCTYSFCC